MPLFDKIPFELSPEYAEETGKAWGDAAQVLYIKERRKAFAEGRVTAIFVDGQKVLDIQYAARYSSVGDGNGNRS